MRDKKKKKDGFTLIELLAVIIILGIVITIVTIGVARKIKTAKNQAFLTAYEVVLDSVQKSITSKSLNLSDDSDIICFDMDECSKIHHVSKDNYIMSVVKKDENTYVVAVTGKGNFENVSLNEIRTDKMTCSSNYCVSEIKNEKITKVEKPEHVKEIKYHYYNSEITKTDGIIKLLSDSVQGINPNNLIGDIQTIDNNILQEYNKTLSKMEINIYDFKYEYKNKYIAFSITVDDKELGYSDFYSFHDDKMNNICMPKYADGGDEDGKYVYYVVMNYNGEVIDSSFLAEKGLCNLPG